MMQSALTRSGIVLVALLTLGGALPAVCAELNHAVLEKAQQSKGDALALLERLVNIDSGTGSEKGLNQITAILSEELKRLGANIQTSPATPNAGLNVVATFIGTGKGKVLLIAHMDTVFKDGTATERPFRIKDGRAYGPGVSDDKGGIVAGLYALKILNQLNFRDYAKITFLLNPNEETGSEGTRELIERHAREHDVALNLESGRASDGLVVWRKGMSRAQIDVKGRASHAGNAPELGRNAAMELAHQMLQMSRLGDAQKQTTINFTVVKAGDRSNVIPDHAMAQADVRAVTPDEFDRVEKTLVELSKKRSIPETEVTVNLNRLFPPFTRNAQTETLIAKAQAIYGELGRKLAVEGSGGAADSSFTAGVGTPTLDALGIVGGRAHSLDEYLEVESIAPRLYLLTRMLMDLGAGK